MQQWELCGNHSEDPVYVNQGGGDMSYDIRSMADGVKMVFPLIYLSYIGRPYISQTQGSTKEAIINFILKL